MSSGLVPPTQAGQPRAGGSLGPCPDGFSVSPGMESTISLRNPRQRSVLPTVQKVFLRFRWIFLLSYLFFFSTHHFSGQVPDRLINAVALRYLHKIGINSVASCPLSPWEEDDVIVLHLGKANEDVHFIHFIHFIIINYKFWSTSHSTVCDVNQGLVSIKKSLPHCIHLN